LIQLARLEGFYWVARLEGYARAARAFPYPISQPGVHQQVSKLEAELGTKLFERVGKDRVILTSRGKALYEVVAPFLDRLATLERSIRTGRVGGTLRVYSSSHLMRHLLPTWFRRVQSRHAEIDLELVEAKLPAIEELRTGAADLVVDHLHEIPSDFEARRLTQARPFIVLAATHPLLKGKPRPLRLADLAHEAFIAYGADRRSRELQLQALALHGVTPARVHTVDSSESILGFVAAGLGYSLIPSVLQRGPRAAGVHTQPLGRPRVEFPIFAVWRKSAARSSLLEAVLKLA
jgi:DNA-binding transcriptional LysR family regulator